MVFDTWLAPIRRPGNREDVKPGRTAEQTMSLQENESQLG
jgi:hypothetical protein